MQSNIELEKIAIVFDDSCQFCQRQIKKIKSMDPDNQFEYVPRSCPDLTIRFPVLKEMNFDSGMRLITTEGNVYVGADAIHQIAKHLPSTKPFAWLYQLPVIKQVCRLVYKWIADNRQKLAGQCETGTCHIDT
jgi:predicted DCC family thiol-disulfide oxidoreductase YuxK